MLLRYNLEMEPLTKKELLRIRLVNEMRRLAKSSRRYKLAYFPGANLVLLKNKEGGWFVVQETGAWHEVEGEMYMLN